MKNRIFITGGAGFIGSNIANFLSKKGYAVSIYDNFERLGTRENAKWLKKNNPQITIIEGDIRDFNKISQAVKKGYDGIFHLAAQVAVTTSVADPRNDFEVNALGTFNILEAVRKSGDKPLVIFSSTNKVYGGMEDVVIVEDEKSYKYRDFPHGISEKFLLDFHSPYGCSKGAADQYVHDYGRMYDIPTVVFRQSCIYGPRQFGIEDQGWVAWFIIATAIGKPITVYGDGKQVRDVLYIDDLVDLFFTAFDQINKSRGQIFNVGGGNKNVLSVWETFGPILEKLFGRKIPVMFADWRPGDQKVYVSDITKVKRDLDWAPKIGVEKGISRLYNWVHDNKEMFKIFNNK